MAIPNGYSDGENVKAWALRGSHVLIDEDRVSVWVCGDEAGWAGCAFVCLLFELHALGIQLALQIADVGERG